MNSLHMNKLSAKTQRVLAVLLLVCMLASLTVVIAPQRVMAADCGSWSNVGCCECAWPCRQDEEVRTCWYMGHSWQEWRCACPSICDAGC